MKRFTDLARASAPPSRTYFLLGGIKVIAKQTLLYGMDALLGCPCVPAKECLTANKETGNDGCGGLTADVFNWGSRVVGLPGRDAGFVTCG